MNQIDHLLELKGVGSQRAFLSAEIDVLEKYLCSSRSDISVLSACALILGKDNILVPEAIKIFWQKVSAFQTEGLPSEWVQLIVLETILFFPRSQLKQREMTEFLDLVAESRMCDFTNLKAILNAGLVSGRENVKRISLKIKQSQP